MVRKSLLTIFTIATLVVFTACQGDIGNNNNNGKQPEPSSPISNEEDVEQEEKENNSTEENEEAVHKGSSLSKYDEYTMLDD